MIIKPLYFDVDGTLRRHRDGHRKSFTKPSPNAGWTGTGMSRCMTICSKYRRQRAQSNILSAIFCRTLPAADYDGFVKNLHAVKTLHYTAMLREGHIPLRAGIKQLIQDAHAAGITLAIATTTTPGKCCRAAGSRTG